MSASDSEEADEAEDQHQSRRRRTTASGAPAAATAEPAAAAAEEEEGGERRTTSGRAVRPPRSRLGEAAAVTSPDLAAVEAAELAEYEVMEAIQRQQQLPVLPGNLSLFKAAPTPAPVVGLAAAALPPLPLPAPAAQQGATLSTSSDASAYSQPQQAGATAATAQLPLGSSAAALPAYGLPLDGVLSRLDAGKWLLAGCCCWWRSGARPAQLLRVASSCQDTWQLLVLLAPPLNPGSSAPMCRPGPPATQTARAQCVGTCLAGASNGAAAVGRPAARCVCRAATAARGAPAVTAAPGRPLYTVYWQAALGLAPAALSRVRAPAPTAVAESCHSCTLTMHAPPPAQVLANATAQRTHT